MEQRDKSSQYPLPPSAIDASLYTGAEQHVREIEQVFFKAWLRVGPSSDVPNPKDYIIWEELRQSVVIARQEDGSLMAWHNVCQHRGARLVEKSGHCATGRFVCPWHGFTYDLSGRLRFAPLKQEFEKNRLEGMRTPPARVDEYLGFIWICFSDDAPDLRTYLGEIATELDWFGLENFDTRYRFDLMLDANWKVVVDAFNETWHVPFTHKYAVGHRAMGQGPFTDMRPAQLDDHSGQRPDRQASGGRGPPRGQYHALSSLPERDLQLLPVASADVVDVAGGARQNSP